MGRLSPFHNSISLGLAIFIVTFFTPSHSAPVQETGVSRYANEKGCYFMNQHYSSGHEIETNDPCMNCTCTGTAMMCYLRVCPFVKPLGDNCKMQKHEGDCCPKYWCSQIYPRVSTPRPPTEARGCYVDGSYYEEGARLPVDPWNPCHACYCIRNVSVCTNETCELHIPGCYPRYKIGTCCPESYTCTEDAATTIPPTSSEEVPPGCEKDGIFYEDGQEVPSNESCKKCYCMRHQVMCTAIECQVPGTNCVPHDVLDGQCCPEKYDCPDDTEIPEYATTHMLSTEEEFLNISTTRVMPSTLTTASVSVQAADEHLAPTSETDKLTTLEAETMFPTTKGIRRIDDEDLLTTVPTQEAEASTTEGTTIATEFVSRPRLPKITEVPDDMFTTVSVPKSTTGRPVFFPSRPIPGEGTCRFENNTYQNGEKAISNDPCRMNCVCSNSVVNCDVVECIMEPPEPGRKCKVKKLPDECCPKYVCEPPISPISNKTEIPEQQIIVDTFTSTPGIDLQETISDTFKTTHDIAIQEQVTETHIQQTIMDSFVTTLDTKATDKELTSESFEGTTVSGVPEKVTETSATSIHAEETEELTTVSSKETPEAETSQEATSDEDITTQLSTTIKELVNDNFTTTDLLHTEKAEEITIVPKITPITKPSQETISDEDITMKVSTTVKELPEEKFTTSEAETKLTHTEKVEEISTIPSKTTTVTKPSEETTSDEDISIKFSTKVEEFVKYKTTTSELLHTEEAEETTTVPSKTTPEMKLPEETVSEEDITRTVSTTVKESFEDKLTTGLKTESLHTEKAEETTPVPSKAPSEAKPTEKTTSDEAITMEVSTTVKQFDEDIATRISTTKLKPELLHTEKAEDITTAPSKTTPEAKPSEETTSYEEITMKSTATIKELVEEKFTTTELLHTEEAKELTTVSSKTTEKTISDEDITTKVSTTIKEIEDKLTTALKTDLVHTEKAEEISRTPFKTTPEVKPSEGTTSDEEITMKPSTTVKEVVEGKFTTVAPKTDLLHTEEVEEITTSPSKTTPTVKPSEETTKQEITTKFTTTIEESLEDKSPTTELFHTMEAEEKSTTTSKVTTEEIISDKDVTTKISTTIKEMEDKLTTELKTELMHTEKAEETTTIPFKTTPEVKPSEETISDKDVTTKISTTIKEMEDKLTTELKTELMHTEKAEKITTIPFKTTPEVEPSEEAISDKDVTTKISTTIKEMEDKLTTELKTELMHTEKAEEITSFPFKTTPEVKPSEETISDGEIAMKSSTTVKEIVEDKFTTTTAVPKTDLLHTEEAEEITTVPSKTTLELETKPSISDSDISTKPSTTVKQFAVDKFATTESETEILHTEKAEEITIIPSTTTPEAKPSKETISEEKITLKPSTTIKESVEKFTTVSEIDLTHTEEIGEITTVLPKVSPDLKPFEETTSDVEITTKSSTTLKEIVEDKFTTVAPKTDLLHTEKAEEMTTVPSKTTPEKKPSEETISDAEITTPSTTVKELVEDKFTTIESETELTYRGEEKEITTVPFKTTIETKPSEQTISDEVTTAKVSTTLKEHVEDKLTTKSVEGETQPTSSISSEIDETRLTTKADIKVPAETAMSAETEIITTPSTTEEVVTVETKATPGLTTEDTMTTLAVEKASTLSTAEGAVAEPTRMTTAVEKDITSETSSQVEIVTTPLTTEKEEIQVIQEVDKTTTEAKISETSENITSSVTTEEAEKVKITLTTESITIAQEASTAKDGITTPSKPHETDEPLKFDTSTISDTESTTKHTVPITLAADEITTHATETRKSSETTVTETEDKAPTTLLDKKWETVEESEFDLTTKFTKEPTFAAEETSSVTEAIEIVQERKSTSILQTTSTEKITETTSEAEVLSSTEKPTHLTSMKEESFTTSSETFLTKETEKTTLKAEALLTEISKIPTIEMETFTPTTISENITKVSPDSEITTEKVETTEGPTPDEVKSTPVSETTMTEKVTKGEIVSVTLFTSETQKPTTVKFDAETFEAETKLSETTLASETMHETRTTLKWSSPAFSTVTSTDVPKVTEDILKITELKTETAKETETSQDTFKTTLRISSEIPEFPSKTTPHEIAETSSTSLVTEEFSTKRDDELVTRKSIEEFTPSTIKDIPEVETHSTAIPEHKTTVGIQSTETDVSSVTKLDKTDVSFDTMTTIVLRADVTKEFTTDLDEKEKSETERKEFEKTTTSLPTEISTEKTVTETSIPLTELPEIKADTTTLKLEAETGVDMMSTTTEKEEEFSSPLEEKVTSLRTTEADKFETKDTMEKFTKDEASATTERTADITEAAETTPIEAIAKTSVKEVKTTEEELISSVTGETASSTLKHEITEGTTMQVSASASTEASIPEVVTGVTTVSKSEDATKETTASVSETSDVESTIKLEAESTEARIAPEITEKSVVTDSTRIEISLTETEKPLTILEVTAEPHKTTAEDLEPVHRETTIISTWTSDEHTERTPTTHVSDLKPSEDEKFTTPKEQPSTTPKTDLPKTLAAEITTTTESLETQTSAVTEKELPEATPTEKIVTFFEGISSTIRDMLFTQTEPTTKEEVDKTAFTESEKISTVSESTAVSKELTSEDFGTSTVPSVKDLDKDVTVSETTDHSVTTLETEIVTDNLFTPMKHSPDSLIKDKTTIHMTETEEAVTTSVMPEITKFAITKVTEIVSEGEEIITQKMETSAKDIEVSTTGTTSMSVIDAEKIATRKMELDTSETTAAVTETKDLDDKEKTVETIVPKIRIPTTPAIEVEKLSTSKEIRPDFSTIPTITDFKEYDLEEKDITDTKKETTTSPEMITEKPSETELSTEAADAKKTSEMETLETSSTFAEEFTEIAEAEKATELPKTTIFEEEKLTSAHDKISTEIARTPETFTSMSESTSASEDTETKELQDFTKSSTIAETTEKTSDVDPLELSSIRPTEETKITQDAGVITTESTTLVASGMITDKPSTEKSATTSITKDTFTSFKTTEFSPEIETEKTTEGKTVSQTIVSELTTPLPESTEKATFDEKVEATEGTSEIPETEAETEKTHIPVTELEHSTIITSLATDKATTMFEEEKKTEVPTEKTVGIITLRTTEADKISEETQETEVSIEPLTSSEPSIVTETEAATSITKEVFSTVDVSEITSAKAETTSKTTATTTVIAEAETSPDSVKSTLTTELRDTDEVTTSSALIPQEVIKSTTAVERESVSTLKLSTQELETESQQTEETVTIKEVPTTEIHEKVTDMISKKETTHPFEETTTEVHEKVTDMITKKETTHSFEEISTEIHEKVTDMIPKKETTHPFEETTISTDDISKMRTTASILGSETKPIELEKDLTSDHTTEDKLSTQTFEKSTFVDTTLSSETTRSSESLETSTYVKPETVESLSTKLEDKEISSTSSILEETSEVIKTTTPKISTAADEVKLFATELDQAISIVTEKTSTVIPTLAAETVTLEPETTTLRISPGKETVALTVTPTQEKETTKVETEITDELSSVSPDEKLTSKRDDITTDKSPEVTEMEISTPKLIEKAHTTMSTSEITEAAQTDELPSKTTVKEVTMMPTFETTPSEVIVTRKEDVTSAVTETEPELKITDGKITSMLETDKTTMIIPEEHNVTEIKTSTVTLTSVDLDEFVTKKVSTTSETAPPSVGFTTLRSEADMKSTFEEPEAELRTTLTSEVPRVEEEGREEIFISRSTESQEFIASSDKETTTSIPVTEKTHTTFVSYRTKTPEATEIVTDESSVQELPKSTMTIKDTHEIKTSPKEFEADTSTPISTSKTVVTDDIETSTVSLHSEEITGSASTKYHTLLDEIEKTSTFATTIIAETTTDHVAETISDKTISTEKEISSTAVSTEKPFDKFTERTEFDKTVKTTISSITEIQPKVTSEEMETTEERFAETSRSTSPTVSELLPELGFTTTLLDTETKTDIIKSTKLETEAVELTSPSETSEGLKITEESSTLEDKTRVDLVTETIPPSTTIKDFISESVPLSSVTAIQTDEETKITSSEPTEDITKVKFDEIPSTTAVATEPDTTVLFSLDETSMRPESTESVATEATAEEIIAPKTTSEKDVTTSVTLKETTAIEAEKSTIITEMVTEIPEKTSETTVSAVKEKTTVSGIATEASQKDLMPKTTGKPDITVTEESEASTDISIKDFKTDGEITEQTSKMTTQELDIKTEKEFTGTPEETPEIHFTTKHISTEATEEPRLESETFATKLDTLVPTTRTVTTTSKAETETAKTTRDFVTTAKPTAMTADVSEIPESTEAHISSETVTFMAETLSTKLPDFSETEQKETSEPLATETKIATPKVTDFTQKEKPLTTTEISMEEGSTIKTTDAETFETISERKFTTESKPSTSEAGTTVTEHTIITEETISSNVTFAADSLVRVHTTTTEVPTSSVTTETSKITTLGESVSEIASTVTPTSTEHHLPSIGTTSGTPQDVAVKSETSPSTSKPDSEIPQKTTTEFATEVETESVTELIEEITKLPPFKVTSTIEEKSPASATSDEFLTTAVSTQKVTDEIMKEGTETSRETTTVAEKSTLLFDTTKVVSETLSTKPEVIKETTLVSSTTKRPVITTESLSTFEAETQTAFAETTFTTLTPKDVETSTSQVSTTYKVAADELTSVTKETGSTVTMTESDASVSTQKVFDTATEEKLSTLEGKFTTVAPSGISDTHPDYDLPEGFYSRKDEKVFDMTTETRPEQSTESLGTTLISTLSDENVTLAQIATVKETFENISTTLVPTKESTTTEKSLKTTKIQESEIHDVVTEKTPKITTTFAADELTKAVTESISEADMTEDIGKVKTTKLHELTTETTTSPESMNETMLPTQLADVTEKTLESITKLDEELTTKKVGIVTTVLPGEVTEKEEASKAPVTLSTKLHEVTTESSTFPESINETLLPTQLADVTEKTLEPTTKLDEEFPTKKVDIVTPVLPGEVTEKEEASEAPVTLPEFKFSTIGEAEETVISESKATTFTVSVKAETKLTVPDILSTTEVQEMETSTAAITTEKYPEVSESTSSTATTVSAEGITEEITTLKSALTTDEERRDFTSQTASIPDEKTIPTMKHDVPPVTATTEEELPEEDECVVNGISYKDGEAITTLDPCEKCHCALGEIKCFKIICKLPKEGCHPSINSTAECCPSSYECPEEDTTKTVVTTMSTHVVSDKDLTTPIPISFMFSTMPTSIASTLLVTKFDDDAKDHTKESTEPTTDVDLQTSGKDVTSTVSETATSETTSAKTEADVEEFTFKAETPEAIPSSTGTEIVPTVSATVKETEVTTRDLEATTAAETAKPTDALISTFEERQFTTESGKKTTTFVSEKFTTEKATTAKEQISTFAEPKFTYEGEKTITTSIPEKLTTELAETVKELTTEETQKEDEITEATKEPTPITTTETPTTFDTTKTTFSHEEKVTESTTLSSRKTTISHEEKVTESTTLSSPKTTISHEEKAAEVTESTTLSSPKTTISDEEKAAEVTESITLTSPKSTEVVTRLSDVTATLVSSTTETGTDVHTEKTAFTQSTTLLDVEKVTTERTSEITIADEMKTTGEIIYKAATPEEKVLSEKVTTQTTIDEEIQFENMTIKEAAETHVTESVSTSETTTTEEEIKVSTSTLIPSNLTKFDDIPKTTESDIVKTTVTKIQLGTEAAETVTTEITDVTFDKETKETDIPKTESVSTIVPRTTDFAKTEIITVTLSGEELTTSKIMTEPTEDGKLSTTLSPVTTMTSKITSPDTLTVTERKLVTESALTTTITKEKDETARTTPKVSPEEILGEGKETEFEGKITTSTSLREVSTVPSTETTDYEIVTEFLEMNKTFTSLDREGTTFIPENETEFSTAVPFITHIAEEAANETTASERESEKPETTTSIYEITDKIFTFVSTRFTDMMKGITEFPTEKAETDLVSTSTKDSMSSTAEVSTEKDEMITPLVHLTRRIDLEDEKTTDIELTSLEAETLTSQMTEEFSTKESVTMSADKEITSDFERKTVNETETTTYKADVATKDIFTTIASIITSLKQETVSPVSESEKTQPASTEPAKQIDIKTTDVTKDNVTKPTTAHEFTTTTEAVSIFKADTRKPTTFGESTSSHVSETELFTEKITEKTTKLTTSSEQFTQEETKETKPIQETKTEPTTTEKIIEQTTSTEVSLDVTTSKLSAETLKTDSTPEKVSEVTSEAKTESTSITFTDQVKETTPASRATRKDMELEVTPAAFTKSTFEVEISTHEDQTKETEDRFSSEATLPSVVITMTPPTDTVDVSKPTLPEVSVTEKEMVETSADLDVVTQLTEIQTTVAENISLVADKTDVTKTPTPFTISTKTEEAETVTVRSTMEGISVTEEEMKTTQKEALTSSQTESPLPTKLTTKIDEKATTVPSLEKEVTTVEPKVTTIAQEAETVTPSSITREISVTEEEMKTTQKESLTSSQTESAMPTKLDTKIDVKSTTVPSFETKVTTVEPQVTTIAREAETMTPSSTLSAISVTEEEMKTTQKEVPTSSQTESSMTTKLATKIDETYTTVPSLETKVTTIEPQVTTIAEEAETVTPSSTMREISVTEEEMKTTQKEAVTSSETESAMPTKLTTKIDEKFTTVPSLETKATTVQPQVTTIAQEAETVTPSSTMREISVTEEEMKTTQKESLTSSQTESEMPTKLATKFDEKSTTVPSLETKVTTAEPQVTTVAREAETVTPSSTLSAISVTEEEMKTTQKEAVTSAQTESAMPTKMTTKIDEKFTTVPSLETKTTTVQPQVTTIAQEAETATQFSTEMPSTASEVSSPEVSTLSPREETVTELLTKGYKAIETTTMQEEEDYLIDENTCIFEGRIYQSAEQIPRADPCEFCFCFRGDIICLQQSCPPPAPNCNQTMIPGYCCPRYECPVYVTSRNITSLSRRKGVNPIIIQQRIEKREIRPTIEVKGCQINGTFYELGKTVTSASGPCLHCVCQADGYMHCDPQRCKPEAPLMLKMNSNYFRRR